MRSSVAVFSKFALISCSGLFLLFGGEIGNRAVKFKFVSIYVGIVHCLFIFLATVTGGHEKCM
jgi:NADH:ubiquinone oxidoreductase subunit 6 (subunit J)